MGIFIATLPFHQKALEEAKKMNIKLIDDKIINNIMRKVNSEYGKSIEKDKKIINNNQTNFLGELIIYGIEILF